jgi:hypothetical protein
MNSFKGKVAFIGESAWISKSMRGVKLAHKTEAIPQMEWYTVLLDKEKKFPFDGDGAVW